MKRLIICNTFSQLIIAIQLKLTLFKDDSIDLWLSDHSYNADKVIKPLNELKIFNNIKYIEEKDFVYARKIKEDVIDIIKYSFGKTKKLDIPMYDEIIFYSLSFLLYSIADNYKIYSHNVVWAKMEEGIFSYNTDFASGNRIKISRFLRKIIGKYEIAENITKYYCYFPELKDTHLEWDIIKIPSIKNNDDELICILKKVFGIKKSFFDKEYKYIYFSSSSDIDGDSYGETELVLKIADTVGKDNLIVKMHPRDKRKVYQNYGIKVMDNSWVPWEIIQLAEKLNQTTLITVTSGAFISISAIMQNSCKGFFLFPEIESYIQNYIKRKNEITSMLEKLHKNNICTNICTAYIKDI